MKRHPLSACYWDLDDDALAALAADIKKHGLRQPIVMYQGQVLDGWQRFRACQIAKVQHRETTYSGDDPAGYVESLNEQRRHGNAGQRLRRAGWLKAHLGSTSNSSDRQTQDSTTTGADRDGPLRPSLLTQPAPTYCFGHSERYCQLCELFGSRR